MWPQGSRPSKSGAERQLADAHAHLVVADRVLGPVVEDEVAEVGVGVQAAEVGLAELHQDLVRGRAVAGVLEIVGLGDRDRSRSRRGPIPGRTCSISNAGRGPRAMIGLAHSSIGSSSSPQ